MRVRPTSAHAFVPGVGIDVPLEDAAVADLGDGTPDVLIADRSGDERAERLTGCCMPELDAAVAAAAPADDDLTLRVEAAGEATWVDDHDRVGQVGEPGDEEALVPADDDSLTGGVRQDPTVEGPVDGDLIHDFERFEIVDGEACGRGGVAQAELLITNEPGGPDNGTSTSPMRRFFATSNTNSPVDAVVPPNTVSSRRSRLR